MAIFLEKLCINDVLSDYSQKRNCIHFTTLGLDIYSSEDMREQVLNCYNELLNETYHNQLQPKSSLCNKHCILI